MYHYRWLLRSLIFCLISLVPIVISSEYTIAGHHNIKTISDGGSIIINRNVLIRLKQRLNQSQRVNQTVITSPSQTVLLNSNLKKDYTLNPLISSQHNGASLDIKKSEHAQSPNLLSNAQLAVPQPIEQEHPKNTNSKTSTSSAFNQSNIINDSDIDDANIVDLTVNAPQEIQALINLDTTQTLKHNIITPPKTAQQQTSLLPKPVPCHDLCTQKTNVPNTDITLLNVVPEILEPANSTNLSNINTNPDIDTNQSKQLPKAITFHYQQGTVEPIKDMTSALDTLVSVMQENSKLVLEIKSWAHALDGKPTSSRRLSMQRARYLKAYIVESQIDKRRIFMQPQGAVKAKEGQINDLPQNEQSILRLQYRNRAS